MRLRQSLAKNQKSSRRPGYSFSLTALAAPFFPIGLISFLPNGDALAIEVWMAGGFFFGWGLYVLLSVIIFKAKSKGVFLVLFFIFCVLLAFNVVGCRHVLESASQIQ